MHPGGSRRPRPAKVAIIIAGIIALLAFIIVAFYGGAGGALVFLAAATALAGLYMLATGQRPWSRVLRGRKVGAVMLVASLVLFIAGTLSLPRTDVADPSPHHTGTKAPILRTMGPSPATRNVSFMQPAQQARTGPIPFSPSLTETRSECALMEGRPASASSASTPRR